MKLCSFRDGEIITKDILKEAMGEQGYELFEKANDQLKDEKEEQLELTESQFQFEEVKESELDDMEMDFEMKRGQGSSVFDLDKAKTLAGCADQLKYSFVSPVLVLVSIQLGIDNIPEEFWPGI